MTVFDYGDLIDYISWRTVCRTWYRLLQKYRYHRIHYTQYTDQLANRGQIHMLEWQSQRTQVFINKIWSPFICIHAVRSGDLNTLKWVCERTAHRNVDVISEAAKTGQTAALKWCLDQNFPVSVGVYTTAAETGQLEIIKLLHNYRIGGFIGWTRHTIAYAARGGYNELLKWLLERSPANML